MYICIYVYLYIYSFCINFGISMIYPKERVCYLYVLDANFLAPKSGYCCENQPVLRPAIN